MLLKKIFFQLIFYSKKKINIKNCLNMKILYVIQNYNISNIIIALNFLKIFLKKKYFSFYLSYSYYLKIRMPNLKFFNSLIIFFINILNNFNFKFNLEFNILKKYKNYYTILRSPFVHSSSKESLIFEYYVGMIVIRFKKNNLFFFKYWEFILSNILKNWNCSKYLLKRLIFLK